MATSAWLQTQYDTGALAAVGEQVTAEEWATVGTALHAGDLETVRTVLKDVQLEGIGPVVLPKRNLVPWIIAGAIVALALIALIIWLVSRDDDDGPTADIPTTLAENPDYSTLSGLLGDTALGETLTGEGPFTMFAPDNDAFSAMPAGQLDIISADPAKLDQFLNYLVVAEKASLTTDDLAEGALTTLEGSDVAITKSGDDTKVNEATIVDDNIEASNGIIQGIDKVLIPPDLDLTPAPTQNVVELLQADPNFSAYFGLLDAAGLTSTLSQTGPFTIFAPDNDAFAAVDPTALEQVAGDPTQLRALLGYTIVPGNIPDDQLKSGQLATTQGASLTIAVSGSTVTVDDATIVPPQLLATNGVVHGLDAVIVPPGFELAPQPTEDIVQVVSGNPDYSTLSQLLTSSGLASLLSETGPYTFFAPNNEAFAALPADQLKNLQSDPSLARNVLAYQIVLGSYPTSALKSGPLTSLEGGALTISVQGDTVKVNTATIVDPNLLATNGVVQGINQLLVPAGTDINPPPPETTVPPTTAAPTTTGAPATTAPPDTAAPPTAAPTTTVAPTTTTEPSQQSLYEALSESPEYSLYLQLVDAAGLKDRMSDASDAVTLFAPTNGAFGADPATQQANIEKLLGLPAAQLQAIVAYQAADEVLTESQLTAGQVLTTLNPGQSLTVIDDEGFLQIKGAQNVKGATIVDADRDTGTSIIQGVDKLLVPNGVTIPT